MTLARSVTLRTAAFLLLGAAVATAQVNVSSLASNGWYSDDTRADGSGTQVAGTNLVSPVLTDNPEATASGNPAHDADIFGQLLFGAAPGTVPAGTWGGALHLFIDPAGGIAGKSTISHRKDTLTGHAPGSVLSSGFTAQYSWMGNGDTAVTAALKFGIKTADFGSTPVSSRTGENAWDKILIYEPGNGNGGTSNGLWNTETINFTTGKWWFFDRTVAGSTIGSPMTLSSMSGNATVFSGAKTIGQVYALITAPGARITSVQFGIGSANPNGSVYVNQVQTSAYLGGALVTYGSLPLVYNQNVTPDAIFGGGNANGSYTVNRQNGIELGLRGKLRYPSTNVFNSNGDGSYTFHTGTGGGPAGNSEWTMEWSVNTNFDGSHPTRHVGDLTYQIGMDNDPGPGTNFLVFDPIAVNSIIPYSTRFVMPFWDHSMGDNTTPNGAGLEATDAPTYAGYLGIYNVAQNSWKPTFYQNTAPYSWNPNVTGRYEYYLAALDAGVEVARSHITIVVAPVIAYNQNVTPDAIYGGGNANGSYTTARAEGVELGMRGKLRFPASNVFNSNGDGTYTFDTGSGSSGFPNSEWAFEWSVNTNYDGSSGLKVGNLNYRIGMDNDPGGGTNYLIFDPITIGTIIPWIPPSPPIPFWDHSMGNNLTLNGGGLEATSTGIYAGYLTTYNVAQNSWQPIFFQNTFPYAWNPNTVGRYEYYLAARSGTTEIERTAITIIATSGSTLILEGDTCQSDQDSNLAGTQIKVKLYARNLASAVSGYEAFLGFDPSKLTYVGADSSYSLAPFPAHVQSIATANVASGKLRLDGTVPIIGGGSTTADSLLATLYFTASSECSPAVVSFDHTQPFESDLSFQGSPLTTARVDSPSIVSDATPPVIGQAPNVTVAADASSGCGSAVVTWTTPSATDNCGGVTVECFPPSGTTFPAGTTTPITVLATDTCGNTTTKMFNVTVTLTNVVQLNVQLAGVTTATTRCIHFQPNSCSTVADVQLSFNASGLFSGEIQVPCGAWTTLCAKDRQHTKWANTTLGLSGDGKKFVAATTLTLNGGDTDNDGDVDIHDVTWFIAQFGGLTVNGGCPYVFGPATRDADFSDNGAIGAEDYSFLVANWLTTSSCSCSLPDTYGGGNDRTAELRSMVEVHDPASRAADLNHDGIVDWRDVQSFEKNFGLSGDLSRAMRGEQSAGH